MAIDFERNTSIVRVSSDGMTAYLSLCPPENAEYYTASDLEEILNRNDIVYGVQREVLIRMINNKIYDVETEVAHGVEVCDGQDGEFEFLFNLEQQTKPKILPDGSVDYGSMQDVPVVESGDELVHYKPAVAGKDGTDVYGKVIPAKIGRELPQLKGKGFYISEDKRIYYASFAGKVEYENERLLVSNVITIDEDVTIVTGDIHFAGDVFVKGNVVSGMTIEAKGSITVNGYVEAANLFAGKDVILKNGMQGGGKGEIRAGGEVSGKFFEQTTIYAKGIVRANAILNCHIMSEQEVSVLGKRGIIVGGVTSAIKGIEATIIGNMSEVKTKIELGVGEDVYSHIRKVKEKYNNLTEENKKIEDGIKKINTILEKADNPDLAEKKLYLMRTKIERDTKISGLQQEIRRCKINIENAQGAKLKVNKSIYRGAKITINGVSRIIESENYNVTYYKDGAEISFKPNI